LLFLLIGPFFFFSDYGGLTQLNPVLEADLSVQFLLNKTMYSNNGTTPIGNSSIPYKLYSQDNGFLRQYDEELW
jgi:hypothetical protein